MPGRTRLCRFLHPSVRLSLSVNTGDGDGSGDLDVPVGLLVAFSGPASPSPFKAPMDLVGLRVPPLAQSVLEPR